MENSMRRRLLIPIFAAVLIAGCKVPPSQKEMAAVDYGPRPDNYEQIVRDYLKTRLVDPAAAIVEFRAGPKELYQQDSALRARTWGWAVCVSVNDKNKEGKYDGYYPVVLFIRDGRVVTANGAPDDSFLGGRYARAGCNELGAPFVSY
jgi:hypothetical protein